MAANLVAQNRQFAVDFQRSLLNVGLQCEERTCDNPISTLGNALGYSTYLEIVACVMVLLVYVKIKPEERIDMKKLMAYAASEAIEDQLRAGDNQKPGIPVSASMARVGSKLHKSLSRTFSRSRRADSASSFRASRGQEWAGAADAPALDCVVEMDSAGGGKPKAGGGKQSDGVVDASGVRD